METKETNKKSSSPSPTSPSTTTVTTVSKKSSMMLNFRAPSFVCSRAQAWRERFANTKRSLSDSCQDVPSATTMSTVSFAVDDDEDDLVSSPNNVRSRMNSKTIVDGRRRHAVNFQHHMTDFPSVLLPEYDPQSRYGNCTPVGSPPSHSAFLPDESILSFLGFPMAPDEDSQMAPTQLRQPLKGCKTTRDGWSTTTSSADIRRQNQFQLGSTPTRNPAESETQTLDDYQKYKIVENIGTAKIRVGNDDVGLPRQRNSPLWLDSDSSSSKVNHSNDEDDDGNVIRVRVRTATVRSIPNHPEHNRPDLNCHPNNGVAIKSQTHPMRNADDDVSNVSSSDRRMDDCGGRQRTDAAVGGADDDVRVVTSSTNTVNDQHVNSGIDDQQRRGIQHGASLRKDWRENISESVLRTLTATTKSHDDELSLQQRLQQSADLSTSSGGDHPKGSSSSSTAAAIVKSTKKRPTGFKTFRDESEESAMVGTSSPTSPPMIAAIASSSSSSSTTSTGGCMSRSGARCCMPLPSSAPLTPSPPSPTPPSLNLSSAQLARFKHGSSGSAATTSTGLESHISGIYGRSESIASLGSGSGGCLSSLYSSLDRRSRMRLVHQMSMDETRSFSIGRAATPAATAAAAAAAPAVAAVACAAAVTSPTSSPDFAYRTLKSSSAASSSAAAAAVAAAISQAAGDRRKRRLLRKQTNSAPDSLEDNAQFTDRLCVTYYLDNVYNKGRNLQARRSWQGEEGQDMLLKVNTDFGSNIKQDGNRDGSSSPYINLPSPNVQSEESDTDVLQKLSSFGARAESDHEDIDAQGPPASALARRRALVPPKLLSDQYDHTNELSDSASRHSSQNGSTESLTMRKRRSSIVVIPPMQICPGDLLVYSKVLTHRNNLLDLDGSTQSLAGSEDSNRSKAKNTWSLLRLNGAGHQGSSGTSGSLDDKSNVSHDQTEEASGMFTVFKGNVRIPQFDRSSRTKSESLFGLEEVLTTITPSDFQDEQLSKYKGMLWMDFMAAIAERQFNKEFAYRSEASPSLYNLSSSANTTSTTSSSTSPIRQRASSPEMLSRLPGTNVTESVVSKNDIKRQEAVWDLFQSECLFLYDHLMVLKNAFMEPLKKVQVEGFAMFAEPEVLFGNLDELCCVTYSFCKEFINLILQNFVNGELQTMEVLIKLFQKSTKAMSLSQAYHRYALNYINALNYLETLRRHVEFNEFEKWCSRDPRCKKLQLTDLLVAPVQHIMKIPIILKDIETRTDDFKEKEIILLILEMEENSLRELDDKMKWLKNFERLLEIQRNIMWPSVLDLDPKTFIPEFLKEPLSKQPCERLIVSPRRQIIMEGALQLIDAGKPTEMYVILFDDMLLITRRKKGLHKKKSSISENWSSTCGRGNPLCDGSGLRYIVYRQPLSLDRFFIHDVSPQAASTSKLENAFVLVSVNRFQQIVAVYTLQSPSDQTKGTWLTKLKEAQEKWKRMLQNTVFRNQMLSGTRGGSVK